MPHLSPELIIQIQNEAGKRYPNSPDGSLMMAGYVAAATAYAEKAQLLADALEKISLLEGYSGIPYLIAKEALAAWNEGKGEEKKEAKP